MGYFSKKYYGLNFPTGSELVTNGNFNSDISNWTKTGAASTISWVNGVSGNGSTGFLRMTVGTTTAWDRFYQSNAAVVVNSRYQLTFWYRTNNITGYFYFFTAQSGAGYTYYKHHQTYYPSTSWTKETLIFQTNIDSSYPNYPFYGFTKNGTIGTTGASIDFDAISLKKIL